MNPLQTGLFLFCVIAFSYSEYVGQHGDPCNPNDSCNFRHSCCQETPEGLGTYQCTCEDGYTYCPKYAACMKFKEIGESVDETCEVCPCNAEIIGGECACSTSNHDGKVARDGETCGARRDFDCTKTSECNQQRGPLFCKKQEEDDDDDELECHCQTGFTYDKKLCHCILDGSATARCNTYDTCGGMQCVNGFYRCATNEVFNMDSKRCIPRNARGGLSEGDRCDNKDDFCSYGLTCFPHPLGLAYCVELSDPCGAQVLTPLFLLISLMTILAAIITC